MSRRPRRSCRGPRRRSPGGSCCSTAAGYIPTCVRMIQRALPHQQAGFRRRRPEAMVALHVVLGIAVLATTLVAGLWGGVAWFAAAVGGLLVRAARLAGGGGAPGGDGGTAAAPAVRAMACTTSTASCRSSSPCSARRPGRASEHELVGLDFESLPHDRQRARAGDRPPRDRHHGRLRAGHLPARAASGDKQRLAADRLRRHPAGGTRRGERSAARRPTPRRRAPRRSRSRGRRRRGRRAARRRARRSRPRAGASVPRAPGDPVPLLGMGVLRAKRRTSSACRRRAR